MKSKTQTPTVYKLSYGLQCTFGWNSNHQASIPYIPTTWRNSTCLVLKGVPPNVPIDKIQADLMVQELWVVKISHIMRTDKATQTLITKYPVFVITFQTGTDVCEILQIKKVCHYITQWEKYKNNKPVCQFFNCQSFNLSSNFCGKSPKCVKCDQPHATRECNQPIGTITSLHFLISSDSWLYTS